MNERRRWSRRQIEAPLEMLVPEYSTGLVRDLSERGLRVTIKTSVDKGAKVVLVVRPAEGERYVFPAKVLWVEPQGEQHLCGVQVDARGLRELSRLKTWLRKQG